MFGEMKNLKGKKFKLELNEENSCALFFITNTGLWRKTNVNDDV